jgi:hypothetical protein
MSVIDVAPAVVARFVVVHACIIQAAQGNARGSADIMVKKVKYFAS